MDKAIHYEMDEEFGDNVLSEHGNTFFSLRKIKWGDRGDFKLDLRKYYATTEGERMSKGCVFDDECAGELVRVLLEKGYGNDKDLYETIKQSRPYITSHFYNEMATQGDPAEMAAHLDEYPVNTDDEELYDLEEVV